MSAVWCGMINYTSIPTHVMRVVFSRDAGLRVARGSGRQFKEGDIGVCGIAVLANFSCGISVILILNCGIAVFSNPVGCVFFMFW